MQTPNQAKDPLAKLIDRNRRPPWRGAAWAIVLAVCAFVGWTMWAQIDEVAIAVGEVKPQGRTKVVQHLEGGIIQEILVSEGDAVSPGDVVVRLDLAAEGINREDILVQLDGLALKRTRLQAEASGAELSLPEELVQRLPDVAASERQSFQARAARQNSVLSVIEEQIRQRESELRELEARRRAVAQDYALSRERFEISESLLVDGLTSRMEHLQLQRDLKRLSGEIAVIKQAMPRARASIEEGKARLVQERDRFRDEIADEMSEVELAIARSRELLQRATRQIQRADIRSPTNGVVKNMRYNTIGGVVRPGEPIMDIVPSEDSLIIEARLHPVDRGYVRAGQDATVKISTYDFVRYGSLDGSVQQISADTIVDQDGQPYYRVIVATDRAYLGENEGSLPISPGMQATVDIHTGQRTVADYLVRPVLKLRHEAFRER
ncbi:MAG: HlyD family type I secretion periplasmic adaptor subunit [Alphaproteobacteria bacterium]|nr:HlyD family type I secretion periplasmic adaptor subunit [Alphaproteobacteria bacterium]